MSGVDTAEHWCRVQRIHRYYNDICCTQHSVVELGDSQCSAECPGKMPWVKLKKLSDCYLNRASCTCHLLYFNITVQCTEWSGQCIVQRIDIMLFPSAHINESWHCASMLEWITTDQYNASQWFTWVHNVSAMSNRVPQQHLFNINNDIIGLWVVMILLLNGNLVQESWMLFTEQ